MGDVSKREGERRVSSGSKRAEGIEKNSRKAFSSHARNRSSNSGFRGVDEGESSVRNGVGDGRIGRVEGSGQGHRCDAPFCCWVHRDEDLRADRDTNSEEKGQNTTVDGSNASSDDASRLDEEGKKVSGRTKEKGVGVEVELTANSNAPFKICEEKNGSSCARARVVVRRKKGDKAYDVSR